MWAATYNACMRQPTVKTVTNPAPQPVRVLWSCEADTAADTACSGMQDLPILASLSLYTLNITSAEAETDAKACFRWVAIILTIPGLKQIPYNMKVKYSMLVLEKPYKSIASETLLHSAGHGMSTVWSHMNMHGTQTTLVWQYQLLMWNYCFSPFSPTLSLLPFLCPFPLPCIPPILPT